MFLNVGADASAQTEPWSAYSGQMSRSRTAELGALFGGATRAQLLDLLLDGRASTVGELARASHVAMSTASEHLSRLLDAGLVRVHAQGRHRYYRLAGPEVAGLLEAMEALPLPGAAAAQDDPGAGQPEAPARNALQPGSRTPAELRFARTCYDHLAGSLAVALHDLLVTGADDGAPELAPDAPAALALLGVDGNQPAGSRRPRLRNCLDWSERKPHLAGATGAALLACLLDRGWLVRRRTPRAVRLTRAGRDALAAAFGPHPCWAPLAGQQGPRS
jgi:DNA-binding transcriptional ArsR family regulator